MSVWKQQLEKNPSRRTWILIYYIILVERDGYIILRRVADLHAHGIQSAGCSEASPHKRRLKCDTKHQSQEADVTFITSDGSKPYKPWRTLNTDDDDN